ncbi:hypothetical protein H0H93_014960, partial [Arthromyces matolae]
MLVEAVQVRKVPRGRPKWRRTWKSHNELRAEHVVSLIDIEAKQIGLTKPWKRDDIRDPYATRAEYLLHSQQPYPGDDIFKDVKGRRFLVYRTSDTEYVIMDDKRQEDYLVEDWLITSEDFPLALHYAMRMAEEQGINIE